MATTSIYLDKRKGEAPFPLKLTITHERKAAYVLLGYELFPEQWDGVKVVKHPRAMMINNQLLARKAEIDCAILEWQKAGKLSGKSAKDIKVMVERMENTEPERAVSFADKFLEFANRKKGITHSTYKFTYNTIAKYCEVGELSFDEITPRWLQDFDRWLEYVARHSVNTRSIHYRYMRAVFNEAIDEGLTQNYPFRKFKIKREETQKRALSLSELQELFAFPVEEYQQKYVDMFKLMFLLRGINLKDLAALTRDNVRNGRIEYYRAKTKKLYSIKIEPEIQELLDKLCGRGYLVNICDTYKDYVNYEARFNRELKKIGPVKIGKRGAKTISPLFPKLSGYWARHSFASVAYNDCGVSMDLISDMLGHSNGMAVTNVYIRRNEKVIDAAARKVIDKVLYGK